MLKFKIKDEEYAFANAEELLIKDYENLAAVLNDPLVDEIDRFFKAFVMLGIDGDILDELDGFSFLRIIKEFRDVEMPVGEFTQFLEIEGRTYQSFDEEFFFSVKDMKMIEAAVKKNPTHFIGEVMAIIFKDVELTKTEHQDNAHIKHKAKLIRENVQYKVALPFIASFSKQMIENLESYKNEE